MSGWLVEVLGEMFASMVREDQPRPRLEGNQLACLRASCSRASRHHANPERHAAERVS